MELWRFPLRITSELLNRGYSGSGGVTLREAGSVTQYYFHFEFGNLICGCSYEISQAPEPELRVMTPWGATAEVLEKRDPLIAAQDMALDLARDYKCLLVRPSDDSLARLTR